MKNFKLKIVVFIALVIAISSCQKDKSLTGTNAKVNKPEFNEDMIQLGKKLKNPYTIENMLKAYKNLEGNTQLKSANIKESDIVVTHYYVRFLPNNYDELGILQNDTTLELFDYPIDYELEEGGTYYHDPDLSESEITWQYCAVEKNYVFPNIYYEVIDELFLPETIENSDKQKSSSEWTAWDEIEVEAMKITGNWEESNQKSTKGLLRDKWRPSGIIYVADNSGLSFIPQAPGLIPVVGCKARAYSWFTIKSSLTNSHGIFSINHDFKGHVNYSVKWERNDFDIRSGNWGQAYFNGPRLKEQPWQLIINKGGMSWVYAHIHRGAFTYYYANTWGIKSPPKNGGIFKTRIKIGAMDKSGTAHYYDFNKFFTTPQIKIYKKNSSGYEHSSGKIFETTIHELAHASHWEIGYTYGQYIVDAIFSEPFLPESWAQGVGVKITSDIYGYDWNTWQTRTTNSLIGNGGYTPIVWDMLDTINQRSIYGSSYPIDRVSEYTLKQLEDALYGSHTWTAWRNSIISKYTSNPTRIYLNELFSNYN